MGGEGSRGRRRWLWGVALLVGLQGIATGIYIVLEDDRPPPGAALAYEAMMRRSPPLTLERPGVRRALPEEGTVLLHLWATWCAPCREELPLLLALDVDGYRLVAASTDEAWPVVRHYFDGDPPPAVLRLVEGGDALPSETLPVTFVVHDGRLVARLDGARRWSDDGVRRLFRTLGVGGT